MPSCSPVSKRRVTDFATHCGVGSVAAQRARNIEHGRRLEAEALAESDRFARGKKLRRTKIIRDRDRRLGGAGGADLDTPLGENFEERPAACNRRGRSTGHEREFAFLGLRGRAEGGRRHQLNSALGDLVGNLHGFDRIGGAEIDEDTVFGKATGEPLPAEADLAQLRSRRQHSDDGIAGLRHHLGRAQRHPAIVVGKQARRHVGDVIDLQRMIARPQQT